MYEEIDLCSDWRVFPMDLDMGLYGNSGRAYQHDYKPEDAVLSTVPVTAPAAWYAAGKIEDPYFGMNARELLWMEQKEWWFIKDFDLPRLDGCWRLTFEGVNYRAEAWLNDVQIGVWEGSFLAMRIDLDPKLLLQKGNRLAVRVRAQERAWEDGTQDDPRGFQNSSAHIRTQRPTPQYAYGWNWSPHLIAVGIWRPVRLEWMGAARLEETRIHVDVSDDLKTGIVRFTGDLKNLTNSEQSLNLEVVVTDPNGNDCIQQCEPLKVAAGAQETISLEQSLPDPALWYPNGYGEQPLYVIKVRLVTTEGQVCDERTRRAGFRRIEFIPNTNDEAVQAESGQSNRMWSIVGKPYPWTMVVNGKRVFSKGSNWCPVDNLYRNRDAHVRRVLEFARDAHYVFMRVWGGGLTESDFFYDCCDELGIVCLQEFWFACGSAPAMDYRVFMENLESELKRLRERTSIGLWGGGNEFNPDNHENRPVIDLIHDCVEELDGTREFRRGSPYRGDRHGGLVSTPHYTTNKYRDLLPGRKRLVLLRSECAVGRSPTRPTNIRKFMPAESLWPIDWKQYQNHHAQRPEWEMVSQPFGEAENWDQALVYASVFHCLDSRLNMEFSRANKYESSGCWTWQMNASWPSFHREHIDWYGDPKPVYYWYKNACKPVISLADFERFVYHPGERLDPDIISVNDTDEAVGVEVAIRIYAVTGELLYEAVRGGEIPADGLLRHKELDWEIPLELAESAVYLALRTTSHGKTVHENTYYGAISPDIRFANAQPVGKKLVLDYLGKSTEVSAPHYYTLTEIVDEPTEHDKEQKQASSNELDAVYTATFDLESALVGKSVEIHLPGLSADDTVFLNGKEIGSGELDLENEWNYEADPLRWPFLPVRYYAVPEELVQEKGNVLEIRLSGQRIAPHTDKRFGLTRMIYVREQTPLELQRQITDYERRMEFFTPISKGPKARLSVSFERVGEGGAVAVLTNDGSIPAAFVVLDLENEGSARFAFDEGAHAAILPGESIHVNLVFEGELAKSAELMVRGLNLETMLCPLQGNE
jgi:beta-mannosidase